MSNIELSPSFSLGAEESRGVWQEDPCGLQGLRYYRVVPPASERCREWGCDLTQLSAAPREQKEIRRYFQLRLLVWARQPSPCARASFSVTDTRHRAPNDLAAQSSRQLVSAEDGLAYAAVVAWGAGLQQPSEPQHPLAQVWDHSEPVASCEAAIRRTSAGDMYGPPCYMPDGNT
jgi:hypothetical protein